MKPLVLIDGTVMSATSRTVQSKTDEGKTYTFYEATIVGEKTMATVSLDEEHFKTILAAKKAGQVLTLQASVRVYRNTVVFEVEEIYS